MVLAHLKAATPQFPQTPTKPAHPQIRAAGVEPNPHQSSLSQLPLFATFNTTSFYLGGPRLFPPSSSRFFIHVAEWPTMEQSTTVKSNARMDGSVDDNNG